MLSIRAFKPISKAMQMLAATNVRSFGAKKKGKKADGSVSESETHA